MAVLGMAELSDGRTLTGELRGELKYERKYQVRVDSHNTPLATILKATNIRLGFGHPENVFLVAKSFGVRQRTSMVYEVTWSYGVPDRGDDKNQEGTDSATKALPADVWTGGSTVKQMATVSDKDGNAIKNSAGTVFEGVTIDAGEFTVSLVRCYPEAQLTTVLGKLASFTNTVNSATFLGGAAKTWKCQGGRWTKKVEQDAQTGARNAYIEVAWEFSYRKELWQVHERDVGFMDKAGNTILGTDNKPVKEPWPLNNGNKAAAGTVPTTLHFDVYTETALATEFGTIT